MRHAFPASVLIACLAMAGCSDMSTKQQTTLTGGVGGAAAGAGIAALAGGSAWTGAAIGAAAGTIGGYLVGEKKERERGY